MRAAAVCFGSARRVLKSDCSAIPQSRDRVQKVAIGTRLEVVARQLARFEPVGPTGAIRLNGSDYTGAVVIKIPPYG
jgi:hypothetical protein